MSTVREEMLSLSVTDRLQLLEEIWDSLAETPEAIPVTERAREAPPYARAQPVGREILGGGTCKAPTSEVKRLRLTPEAELDLDEAYIWHRAQAPGLAAGFLGAVNGASRPFAAIPRHTN